MTENTNPGGLMDHKMDSHTVATGAVGVLSTLSSFLISLAGIEASLRIASLIVGLAVGVTTLAKLYAPRKQRTRKGAEDDAG